MEESIKKSSATQETAPGTRFPILVVDDDQAIRTILSSLLSMMGFQVALATNGDEALNLFAKRRFEFVLTDFQMPGMDGFTLASNIKSCSPKTPVIMITGSDESVVQKRMEKGCVDRVLFKPFKLEEVYESVELALTGASNLTGRQGSNLNGWQGSNLNGWHLSKTQEGE